MVSEGDSLPVFEVENQDGETVSSQEIEDAVIYFYPKADTPGCTKEACGFRDELEEFKSLDLDVYGVSVDTVEAQEKFHEKYDLNFDLLADPEAEVAEKFGVLDGKYADRTTFVVEDGEIVKVFSKVDPEEHVSELLEWLKT